MTDAAHWEERYRTGDIPWDTRCPSTELMRVIRDEKIAPCRAIELGCGTGTNCVWLGQQGFTVTGVDLSSLAVKQAKERAAGLAVPVHFLVADLLAPWAVPESFEFFFDRGCYHILRREDVSRYLETLNHILQPGAFGLILAGNAKEPHDPGPPVVEEYELRSELGGLFDIQWLREFRFDQPDETGPRPLGWSCLVRKK